MVLYYLDGPNVIKRVLLRGRQENQSSIRESEKAMKAKMEAKGEEVM